MGCQSFCAALLYACYVELSDLGMRGRGRSLYTAAILHTKPEVQSNIINRYVALEWLTDAVQADLLGIMIPYRFRGRENERFTNNVFSLACWLY